MPDYSTISTELAEFLHQERERILPFIGAGVSVNAGVPAAADLAGLIAARASAEGVELAADASFAVVCAAVSEQLDHLRLQQITASIIDELELQPTPLQQLTVRAPLGVVATTNFDRSLSLAAESAGLTPLVRTPQEAHALDTPQEGEVVIVHLHGHVDEPAGMALPGASMDALANDETFKTVLRGLVIARAVVYLGYRLPPEDTYLHREIETLATMFADRGPHRLLIPSNEREARRAELAALEPFGVSVDTFESDRGYQAVDQAALLIAPAATVEGRESLAPVRDTAEYYLPPTLLPEERERDRTQPDNRLMMAQLGFGDDTTKSPGDLLAARRAVVIAEPGMGKTQLLYHLGELEQTRTALVLKANELIGQLQPDDTPERVLAAALARARAFTNDVGRPTRDALDGNAYTLLFDALDEVAPERRADAVALLTALAERYPQHVMVVTSRVNDDVAALEGAGFLVSRIPRDGAWGRRYLEERGIPEQRIRQLYEDVQTIGDLLAVPQYAALIGQRLAHEPLEAIPATGFELMIEVGVKDAAQREAENLGYSAEQLYRWLRLLAVALELRGRVTASIEELAEIPGPDELRGPEARERLVERALLQDIPDVAALQTNAVQETLAADALLSMDDPLQALKDSCATTLAGVAVFRDDLDHMIDLFYEGAPSELRPALRELDPLRWARTARADAPGAEIEEALDALWELYLERRVWLDTNQGREVRDARSAVERLIRALGDVGADRRARWIDATTATEPTARANASFFLRQLGVDDSTQEWLEPLLTDPNSVVRRHAAAAIASFGNAGNVFLPALRAAYAQETDELAAEAIGTTIFELTQAEERAEAAALLAANFTGWGRISYLVGELPLSDALALFDRTGVRNDTDDRLLSEIAAKVPVGQWTDEQVQTLIRVLLRSRRIYYREFRERELLEELARTHPDAALAAAREAAPEDATWSDLSFLQRIPADALRAAAQGTLEGPLTTLLEILDLRAAQAGAPPPPERPPPPEPPTLVEILDDGSLEARARAQIPRPLLESYSRQVADLDPPHREQLAGIVARLWPEGPLADAITVEGNSGRAPAAFEAALAFATTLDLPLDPGRWLELYLAKAVFFWWSATEWLRRHSGNVDEADVIAAFENLDTEFQVRQALSCLENISDATADAAASALIRINAIDSIFMLRDFRERNQLAVLRRLHEEAEAPEIRRAAQRELAEAGDVEAQRTEVAAMRDELSANPNAYSPEGFSWAKAARPEVMDELAALLRQVADTGAGDRRGIDGSLQTALAATRDERALEAYDAVIGDTSIEGSSFFRYQRDALARQLSREAALDRLPERLADVAQWAIDRGLQI
jgi:SIR2-like domain/HEAT repeats